MAKRGALLETAAEVCCPSVFAAPLDDASALELASGFAALADPARLRAISILAAAEGGEVCVCDLVEPLGKAQPTVSHHLKVLGDAGLVVGEVGHATGREFYAQLAEEGLPEAAVLASLGCGNPTAVADLHSGGTVLDLGSGGGIDVLLSAKRVGPTGKVYGLDITEEMLALAIKNRDEAAAVNVEFLKGYIEDIPLPANTVDVVISNCVINLSTDKSRVFAEMHRVLRPGGRIGISDVVADNELTASQRAERGTYVGCVSGSLSFEEYEAGLRAVGFDDFSITSTSEYLPGIHSAIIKATKPSSTSQDQNS
ncbi:MAG: metalloregulator ArsR/SmtB family transcription factor [Acidimicrobiales bacterium]|jgi:SAM-dependent methyltransferase